ncbi:MAG TPA: hypothetical protein VFO19_11745 [Vicinamibacterales bacterium]|nr:hypothetical protein [Vicinamibacterales bacterium]
MTLAAVIAALVAVAVVWWVLRKGRRLPGEHVFRASRLSRGNRLFPTQVVISDTSVTRFTPQWIGKLEESIHISHVSSIKIDTNLLFADVLIETTGGHHPIICHGHTKGDAVRIKKIIEDFQSRHYRADKS